MTEVQPASSGGPVLLVEDDEALASIVRRHLAARGYTVRVASSAEEAMDLLRSGLRPGLVVLDINLPGDTGWTLARSGLLAAAGSPPIVVASAVTISSARLREYGVAGYLPKPFPLETLVSTIERLLRPKEASIPND